MTTIYKLFFTCFSVVIFCSEPISDEEHEEFYNVLSTDSLVFVDLEKVDFQEVLAESKPQDKVIFLDFYASWCGPCKYMEEQVFTLPRVSTMFSTNFINCKANIDYKSGQLLRQRYRVYDYPTYLFLDSDGEVILRLEGAFNPDVLIDEAEFALKQ